MLEDHARVVARLRRRLGAALPGPPAQALMSPRPRHGWVPGMLPEESRSAATLLLVYPRRGTAHLVLTERRHDLADHPGQISFPGGEVERGETLEAAALREADEEVGLRADDVETLGLLTPLHIPVSGFNLHPVVAAVSVRPRLVPCDTEVARVIEAPLPTLAAPQTLDRRISHRRGSPADVPFFALGDVRVWGATAMVLAEFLALLGAPPDPWKEPERSG